MGRVSFALRRQRYGRKRIRHLEKGFDILKKDIDLMPAHVRTDNTLRGYLFVAFLAVAGGLEVHNPAA